MAEAIGTRGALPRLRGRLGLNLISDFSVDAMQSVDDGRSVI